MKLNPKTCNHRSSAKILRPPQTCNNLAPFLVLLLLLLLLLQFFLLGGSSPYTSTDKTSKNKYT